MTLGLREGNLDVFLKLARYGVVLAILGLTIAGLCHYRGHFYVYILFSVASNALLYLGFRKNAIFFDTFIGIFFWLGFWLKLTIRVIFSDGIFREAVGNFDGSSTAYDQALLVSSCGMFGLICASFIRERVFFSGYQLAKEYKQNGIVSFYSKYRGYILSLFVILFLTVALTNFHFGIYQRGEITQVSLPLGLSGIYKWLLLFGLASVSALVIRCELVIRKDISYTVAILSLLESFITNVSLLSRGMVLNVSALVYGIYMSIKINAFQLNIRLIVTSFLIFILLFISSVYVVNYIRTPDAKRSGQIQSQSVKLREASQMAAPLLLDRWVGIEGVMAVSSSPKLGWDLWTGAWGEKYTENAMSFYDKTLITSPYLDDDFSKVHFISLPGILAFFFYPGSFLFLLCGMFLLGIFASLIEISVFKLGGQNLILCALVAQVVAYRLSSFGYVPAQSYLLFGAIFLNLFIFYYADRYLVSRNNRINRRALT
jgi:hypothetical protein